MYDTRLGRAASYRAANWPYEFVDEVEWALPSSNFRAAKEALCGVTGP